MLPPAATPRRENTLTFETLQRLTNPARDVLGGHVFPDAHLSSYRICRTHQLHSQLLAPAD